MSYNKNFVTVDRAQRVVNALDPNAFDYELIQWTRVPLHGLNIIYGTHIYRSTVLKMYKVTDRRTGRVSIVADRYMAHDDCDANDWIDVVIDPTSSEWVITIYDD